MEEAMSEESLHRKLERLKRQNELLEAIVEQASREAFVTGERARAAAESLREIFGAMPGALLIFDRDGCIEEANETAAAMLGYDVEELKGLPGVVIFDPGDRPGQSPLDAALHGEVLRVETACTTKEDARIPVLLSATPLGPKDEQGNSRVICVALDVRERKRLEVELRQAQKLESVGRLAAGVAHEINTPVQFVSDSVHFVSEAVREMGGLIEKYRGTLRSLSDASPQAIDEITRMEEDADLDYLLENIPKALERSLDGLQRVATIVRSMKEFAHPDQRETSSIDLNQAIQSTLVIARNEYKYVADVVTELGELPRVVCHAGELNQVVLNLIVNAAHAIEDVVRGSDRKGQITVRTRMEGDRAVVSIGDTGVGIPNAIRDHVFEPFFTTKEVGKGTGQGLAIARSVVVDKHGGELTFESEVGQGTTFFIRIPVHGKERSKSAA
jgi:PAS domain S-box-containing protein